MVLNGVQVAPFGPKLGQNDAPDLRIIFQALLGPKTQFKKIENTENYQNPDFYRSNIPINRLRFTAGFKEASIRMHRKEGRKVSTR